MEVFERIGKLFLIKEPKGYSEESMAECLAENGTLPPMLEEFFRKWAKSDELSDLNDEFFMPYPSEDNENYVFFFAENQGAYYVAIRRKDLVLSDPPVYVAENHDYRKWLKMTDHLSEFFAAMLGYEASMCLKYRDEGEQYWLTRNEKARFERRFPKRPESVKSWFGGRITLYNDSEESMISLLTYDGGYQMDFTANNQAELDRIMGIFKEIGIRPLR